MDGADTYFAYTDGSCKAGDGAPGGWGFSIKPPSGPTLEGYGKARGTLAKVMEYQAVAEALAVVPEGATVVVFSDNHSLVENMTRNFQHWRQNGFARVDGLVLESIRRIDASITQRRLSVSWQWIRSHNGNAGNERADELAAKGAREMKAELAKEEEALRRQRSR